jgi:hypothetical protein
VEAARSIVIVIFLYSGFKRDGDRSWHFEGLSLQMILRGKSLLAVLYADDGEGHADSDLCYPAFRS